MYYEQTKNKKYISTWRDNYIVIFSLKQHIFHINVLKYIVYRARSEHVHDGGLIPSHFNNSVFKNINYGLFKSIHSTAFAALYSVEE